MSVFLDVCNQLAAKPSSILVGILINSHNLLHVPGAPLNNIWCVGRHTDLVPEHLLERALGSTLFYQLVEALLGHFVSKFVVTLLELVLFLSQTDRHADMLLNDVALLLKSSILVVIS